MIQSAMWFALGVLVSGLGWLAFSVALVRRTRRLTERRLLASIAMRRAEFETERDELRARHAVDMHRLEREVSRVLDQATAYRLESDVKERDLVSLQAELAAREEDFHEQQAKLVAERAANQELERKHAEAGAALRSVQHALRLEITRRSMAEEALDEAGVLSDRRPIPDDSETAAADEIAAEPLSTAATEPAQSEPAAGGSVVPLPTRRSAAAETPERAAAQVAKAARKLKRLAGEARGDLGKGIWRAPAIAEPQVAEAIPDPAAVADLAAHRSAQPAQLPANAPGPESEAEAEVRFFEALAEIRALKRSAGKAAE